MSQHDARAQGLHVPQKHAIRLPLRLPAAPTRLAEPAHAHERLSEEVEDNEVLVREVGAPPEGPPNGAEGNNDLHARIGE